MKDYCFLFILVVVQLAQCMLPNLVVKKLDKTLIARKRQDTMDMCRMFTEENQKIKHNNHVPKIIKSYIPGGKPRFKRDIGESSHREKRNIDEGTMKDVNPALNPADAKRVESIVDKLYDDLEEKGERVTYRQIRTTSSVKFNGQRNKTLKSRRFDFAPAFLTGPQYYLKKPTKKDDEPFPSQARWKLGIVPYYIDFKTYDAQLSETITKAFDYIEKATCIRLQKLREQPTDRDSLESVPWLYISNPTGIRQCVHSNENRRVNGVMMTVFGYDCMSLGDIVHEVMHILGFSHEHLRSDRDQHISIIWENIKPGYKKFFDLNKLGSEYETERLPYDYSSILHYPPRAFSKNGKATIITEYGIKIGQREGLSEIDVEKVSLIYSNECVKRNRDYLLQTCPSVVKASIKPTAVTQKDIDDYFRERLWPFGTINFMFRDKMEFTVEERENIKAVIRHIEQETCIQFRDVDDISDETNSQEYIKLNDNLTESPGNDAPLDIEETTTSGAAIIEENTDASSAPIDINSLSNDEPTNSTPIETETPSEDLHLATIDQHDTNMIVTQESEDNKDLSENKQAEIVITQQNRNPPKDDNAENDLQKLDIQNVRENEVLRKGKDLKKMSLAKKKALLRKAKEQKKRTRRETGKQGTRRHVKPLLVLKRSASSLCPCPTHDRTKFHEVLEIAAGCFNSVNDLLHFFVHVLGLDHQHNMHDRDNYLHIVWSNLTEEVRQEMANKLPPAASLGFSYDYQSVMHYPWLQIKDGKTNVMYPLWNDGWAMGHWQGLSSVDVQKLNLLYFNQCTKRQEHEKQFIK